MTLPLAHGIGGVRDLPLPTWLFVYGAGVVVLVSFLALALLWRRPLLEDMREGRQLPTALQRILLSRALRLGLGTVSFLLLILVTAAAFLGDTSPTRNITPTFVYVVFWLGVVPLVVLFGNIWPLFNPWKAGADAVAWLAERLGAASEPLVTYPERVGRWPAAVLLFLWAVLELAYFDPADPRALGVAILLYSGITWFGAGIFGRRAWFANAEAFTVYFGFLAKIAPFAAGERDGRREVVVRPPVTGLAERAQPPGTLAFVAVMLGSVGFDGFSRIGWWLDRRATVANTAPNAFEYTGMALNVSGLLLAVALVAFAYLVAVELARALARTEDDLGDAFVASLVPIALVYTISHYFTLLIVQGQAAIRLASDPFGRGWDLLGTADYTANIAPISPNTVWYVQVGTLVAGHVVGLALAHDRAVALFPPRRALRSQFPLVALMVLYTVGGLWILATE